MNKKGDMMDYALIMLFVVIVTLPVLYVRMTSEVEDTKKTIGENQAIILQAPYDKEDMINYVEKSAELVLPNVLTSVSNGNGFVEASCGGEFVEGGGTCSIINTPASIIDICQPDILGTFTHHFNKELDKYIEAYNDRAFTKIPKNNYDVYIDGNDINAIATVPVEKGLAKRGTELSTIGKMWFAPSFTITAEHNMDKYKDSLDILKVIAKNCVKEADPKGCAEGYAEDDWSVQTTAGKLTFTIPDIKACYALVTD